METKAKIYKYRCAECGKIIETDLYYDEEHPSLEGLGVYHSDLEICDKKGNLIAEGAFPAIAGFIASSRQPPRGGICDGHIKEIEGETYSR